MHKEEGPENRIDAPRLRARGGGHRGLGAAGRVRAVEWYYPALEDGVTHVSVDSKTAAQAIDALNGDDGRVARLSEAAEQVHREFTCADCIAS